MHGRKSLFIVFAGSQELSFCRKQSKDCFYRGEAQEKTISLHQGSSYRSTPNKDEFSADAHRKQRDFGADAQRIN